MNNNKQYHSTRSHKNCSKNKHATLALAIASIVSAQAFAQEGPSEPEKDEAKNLEEEVVVFGMRQSLQNAQDLKRNSGTVIDSITSEDLGSFPDKSIAEALQRVPGITVNRFAATSDTAHFSAEPSGVLVRGLNQVRTEYNGRDTFSANSSRGLSWGDVSPELMSGIDTYKNQMAELVEGGIAGTVNMRTRLPFDQEENIFAFTLSANYGDLSEKVTPDVSGLYSGRWDAAGGEIGFLANIAYSNVETRSQGNQLGRINKFRGIYDDVATTPSADSLVYIPASVSFRDNLYDRTRVGGSLALQWQNEDETLIISTQYNRSEYENSWEEYVVLTKPADLSWEQSVFYEIRPENDANYPRPGVGADDFTFDERGVFQTGAVNVGSGWWGGSLADATARAANEAGDRPFVEPCYGWNSWNEEVCGDAPLRGLTSGTETRAAVTENMTEDLSVNIEWAISDSIKSSFDIQHVNATVDAYDITMGFGTFANVDLDMSGARPTMNWSNPTNVNFSEGGFQNPFNYYPSHIMDHLENSEGQMTALRSDFEFVIDEGLVSSIKFGVRYADRDQKIRNSAYNWDSVATDYSSNQAHYFHLTQTEPTPGGTNGNQPGFTGYPDDYYVLRDFNTNFHSLNIDQFYFADVGLLEDRERMANTLSASALGLNGAGWNPVCSGLGDRSEELGGCYEPAELVDVSEETSAVYLQFNFGDNGSEMFGIPYSGNIGLRYVKTLNESAGGTVFPRLGDEFFFTTEEIQVPDDPDTPEDETATVTVLVPDPTRQNIGCEVFPIPTDPDQPPPPVAQSTGCYLSADTAAYANGANQNAAVEKTHHHILPSVNIKWDINDNFVIRLAASRAMSRPDIGTLRNYVSFDVEVADDDDPGDPLWIRENGEIVGTEVSYRGSAQNPFLKPITADQLDLSFEYYFSDTGSFSAALFAKDFDDYIQKSRYYREFTNNGETQRVEIEGPVNGDGAKLSGFELSFQRFFDALPAPFDGLGIQANYTYVDNNGITNTNVKSDEPDGDTGGDAAPDSVEVDRLEGLSDHTYNLVGMYEKGAWAARLAYNWRSEFLVTSIDCCVSYPVWQDDYGQVDGSIQYSINDNFNISLQASNILSEQTVLTQQVNNPSDGGLRLPNAWFQNDRRYTLILSGKF